MCRAKILKNYLEVPNLVRTRKDGFSDYVLLVLVVSLGEVVDDSLVYARFSMIISPLAEA